MSERHDTDRDPPPAAAAVAPGHLEPVGIILQRLELQRTQISELRAETREILARLAA